MGTTAWPVWLYSLEAFKVLPSDTFVLLYTAYIWLACDENITRAHLLSLCVIIAHLRSNQCCGETEKCSKSLCLNNQLHTSMQFLNMPYGVWCMLVCVLTVGWFIMKPIVYCMIVLVYPTEAALNKKKGSSVHELLKKEAHYAVSVVSPSCSCQWSLVTDSLLRSLWKLS